MKRNHSCSTDLSIHDLTRRSTSWKCSHPWRYWSFNSRPHKEVDTFPVTGESISRNLSIHDLTRRSTVPPPPPSGFLTFQFTTSQGGRLYQYLSSSPRSLFQFTTSQGGRPMNISATFMLSFFQFTTSQGGRPEWAWHIMDKEYFQFTTSQGGRLFLLCSRQVS